VWTTGYVEIYFQWHAYKNPFDKDELRLEMLEKFNQIEGISLDNEDINKRPSVRFEVLDKGDRLNQFFEVMNWFIEKVEEHS